MNAGRIPYICGLLIFQKVVQDSLLNTCDEAMTHLHGLQRHKIIYSMYPEHKLCTLNIIKLCQSSLDYNTMFKSKKHDSG